MFGVKILISSLRKVQRATREFLSKCAEMEKTSFFVNQTVDNWAPLYTHSFDPMLFQVCLTTATLIKFTQKSDLNKSVWEILT